MTATASKPRPSGPRAAPKAIAPAEKPAEAVPEPAAGDAAEAATDAPKTLMGQGVDERAAGAPESTGEPEAAPAPEPRRCGFCDASEAGVTLIVMNGPDPFIRCKSPGPCGDRYAERRRAQTTSEDAADHAPASSLDQAQEATGDDLEPLPEETL